MIVLNDFVVKITSKENAGSGFLYFPTSNSECAYIFTALHCILGEDFNAELNNSDLQITITNEKESFVYTLEESDQLLFDENAKDEVIPVNDIAVIIIPQSSLPEWIDKTKSPKLFKLSGNEQNCFISGFPKVENNENKLIVNCQFRPDKQHLNQIQIELTDTIIKNYNADDLVEGYSGSGVFVEVYNEYFACGVVSQYKDQLNRFYCIDFSFLNYLLQQKGFPELELIAIETNPTILADLKTLKENSKRVLNRIKDKIGTIHIERKEFKIELKEQVISNTLTIISGRAGIGKSALTKSGILELQEIFEIIALQGEQLDKNSISDILKGLEIEHSIEVLLDSKGLKSQKILLIDSLEKVLETKNADTILDFFELIKNRNDIKLVLTCRSYAVEQLRVRFLMQFPTYKPFEVSILNEDELTEIAKSYPSIQDLLDKPSLKRLLQIPFNLDKAVLVQNNAFDKSTDTEADFKKIMWDYVIENKEKETDTQIRYERGRLFSCIAIKRAKEMSPYIKIENINQNIVEGLLKDNIIEVKQGSNNRFAPTHDIYEDWALTIFIEDKYQDWQDEGGQILDFYNLIGTETGIKRSFRIWVNEKLELTDSIFETFLISSLKNNDIQQYWKDEILIAIMQSSYSQKFLTSNVEFLLENNQLIFKRCSLLLRVACQRPDFSTLSQLSDEEKTKIYQNYHLKPYGEGWENIIYFIYENLKQLKTNFPSIIPILLQWKKSIDYSKNFPPEARVAGLIIFQYFELYKEGYSDWANRTTKEHIEDCITLLFRLTKVLQEEIKHLLETALVEKYKESDDNWRSRSFYKEVIEYSLNWLYSSQICRFFPELICRIAEKEWFYYPPSEEEWKAHHKGSITGMIGYESRRVENEEKFGITHNHAYEYSPASAYQTFILHLLYFAPEKSLKFIVELFNHSIEVNLKNKKDVKEITYKINDSLIIRQFGSVELWSAYRGASNAPELLVSVLMALEYWLLNLARIVSEDKKKNYPNHKNILEFAFDYLLLKSKSVATTSVLTSVMIAYPDLLPEKILPLLSVKEFYKWDLSRYTHDLSSFNELSFGDKNPFITEERTKSNQLIHRRKNLENLVYYLCDNGFDNVIFPILDNFYAENPNDELWKLALNRMDIRKREITEVEIDGRKYLRIEHKIDEDLDILVNRNQQEQTEIQPIMQASNWARQKFENKELESSSFEEWQKHYQSMLLVDERRDFMVIYNQYGILASVGIRDYFNSLNKEQLTWCINKIFTTVENQVIKNERELNFDSLNIREVLSILPEGVGKCEGEFKQKAKELLFKVLIFIHTDANPYKKGFMAKVRTYLWGKEPEFALKCFCGLIEYASIFDFKTKVQHFYPRNKKEEKKRNNLMQKFQKRLEAIFNFVLDSEIQRENNQPNICHKIYYSFFNNPEKEIKPDKPTTIQEINLDSHSIWILNYALLIIPYDTQIPELKDFISHLLIQILANLDNEDRYNNEKIPYAVQRNFEEYFALFLLNQPTEIALSKFKELIDWVFDTDFSRNPHKDKKYEFVENCLKQIIYQVDPNPKLIPNFWILWEYLFDKIKNAKIHYFSHLVLLQNQYWRKEAINWKPIEGKKTFFEEAVLYLNHLPPTIQLLSGIGFTELMPEGINWFAQILVKGNLIDSNAIFDTEKLVQRCFYDKQIRDAIKTQKVYRDNFILILDKLIDNGSTIAFLIREDFILTK